MKNQISLLILLVLSIFFLARCSSDSNNSSCETIACQNGGVFIDCECSCPEGYTGTNCETQVTPTQIMISKVTVQLFPALRPDGSNWDNLIGNNVLPDLYFQLVTPPSEVIYDSPTFFENADVANNHEFSLDSPIVITDALSPYIISLFDYDFPDADENMAAQSFFIYENDNAFPNTLTIFDSNQPIAVDLELSYQW